jgi:hypothetical protein
MSNFNKKNLLQLIVDIAPGRGTAEHESDDEALFLKNFLPVPDYRRALEPDILLILGGRGVGKTELFRLLAIETGRATLVQNLEIRALPSLDKTIWIATFGRIRQQEKTFPTPEAIEARMKNASNIDWRAFWMGLMLGRMLRRSFLKLFSLAASRRLERFNEQNEQSLPETTLLQPSDLQGALMDTSEDRIRELAQEEYPWLEALKTSLTGLEVPTAKAKFLEVIAATQWSEQLGKRPPTSKPEEVLKYLLQLGIVESRSDGRINMPEIYLYGFEVKRRGGIKRPK